VVLKRKPKKDSKTASRFKGAMNMIDYKDYGSNVRKGITWVFGIIDIVLVLLIFLELNKVKWGLLW
jgi:hypothetical protein